MKCYRFFGKIDTLCFLVTPVLRFALLPYYGQIYDKEKPICIAETYAQSYQTSLMNKIVNISNRFDKSQNEREVLK